MPGISVARAFNGPRESGNGGYSAGLLAGFIEGAAEVSLRSPVPLDTPLEVLTDDDGPVRLVDGETLVAEGRPAPEFELDVPEPVSLPEAHAAAARYRGLADGEFSDCFVCGRGRDDAFGVFAGAVEGRRLVASPWRPSPSIADDEGNVLPEFVWAVLDCPTFFATYIDEELPISFLARLAARIDAPVVAGEEHVVIAWPMGSDGRKRHAGAAVMSGAGETLAFAQGLLIEPRSS